MQIRISLKFSDGDFHQGFGLQKKLVLVVSNEDKSTEIEIKLPPAPEIPVLYQKWKDSYIKLANPQLARIKVKQVTRFSYPERHQECEKIAQELRNKLNQWLSNIKPELEAAIKLNSDSEIIFFVYTVVPATPLLHTSSQHHILWPFEMLSGSSRIPDPGLLVVSCLADISLGHSP